MSISKVSPDTKLIQGMFIPPATQLDIARQRNQERNWGFTEEDFAKLGEPPAWPDGKLSAIVLDISLDTPEQTFEEAWTCATSVQPNAWRWDELKSDSDHLRLLPGITHKRGLAWRIVDLGDNWDQKAGIAPADVRNGKASPHSAILWAASYFPKWIQAMDGVTVPRVWLPGYQVTIAGVVQWSGVPCLDWLRLGGGVKLIAFGAHDRSVFWAVPSFRE